MASYSESIDKKDCTDGFVQHAAVLVRKRAVNGRLKVHGILFRD